MRARTSPNMDIDCNLRIPGAVRHRSRKREGGNDIQAYAMRHGINLQDRTLLWTALTQLRSIEDDGPRIGRTRNTYWQHYVLEPAMLWTA